jgi:hypothetical protein
MTITTPSSIQVPDGVSGVSPTGTDLQESQIDDRTEDLVNELMNYHRRIAHRSRVTGTNP